MWLTLPVAPRRCSRKNLCAFLHACSAPIFPVDTTPGALKYFADNHYKPRQLRKRAKR